MGASWRSHGKIQRNVRLVVVAPIEMGSERRFSALGYVGTLWLASVWGNRQVRGLVVMFDTITIPFLDFVGVRWCKKKECTVPNV